MLVHESAVESLLNEKKKTQKETKFCLLSDRHDQRVVKRSSNSAVESVTTDAGLSQPQLQ